MLLLTALDNSPVALFDHPYAQGTSSDVTTILAVRPLAQVMARQVGCRSVYGGCVACTLLRSVACST